MSEKGSARNGGGHHGRVGKRGNLVPEIRSGNDGARNHSLTEALSFADTHKRHSDGGMVVHELPIITEMNAQITQAVSRNIFGEMIFTP